MFMELNLRSAAGLPLAAAASPRAANMPLPALVAQLAQMAMQEPALHAPARLRIHHADSPQRAAAEAFIASVFARRYGAHVQRFAPVLVALHDAADGRIVAAAGYRHAQAAALYLERYLAGPIEQLLSERAGAAVARSTMVEVGHLAATQAGQGRRLMLQLGEHLAAARVGWVASTLTQELQALFSRLGIAPLVLGTADPVALGEEAQLWGSYYEHRPQVLAGSLQAALDRLAGRRGRPGNGAPGASPVAHEPPAPAKRP